MLRKASLKTAHIPPGNCHSTYNTPNFSTQIIHVTYIFSTVVCSTHIIPLPDPFAHLAQLPGQKHLETSSNFQLVLPPQIIPPSKSTSGSGRYSRCHGKSVLFYSFHLSFLFFISFLFKFSNLQTGHTGYRIKIGVGRSLFFQL